ncbi:hypothetical protein SNE40_008288 [Patella caerulea]|uniref:DUF659 domain-containing protein n=1 Tax=Patella caerulea TaxID=87958 RepID=A0AAN8K6E5_PATCE
MSQSGRKLNEIWLKFERKRKSGLKYHIAECKTCKKEMPGIVDRMKKHTERCEKNDSIVIDVDESLPFGTPSTSAMSLCSSTKTSTFEKLSLIDKFVYSTSDTEKAALDKQCSKFIYATNSSFLTVEHREFKQFIEMLRPWYKPPTRKDVAGSLLDQVHEDLQQKCAEILSGKPVNMSLDGWSNIRNEPIVCISVTDELGNTFVVETVDTSGESHTGEYLYGLTVNCIKKVEEKYGCEVKSFVTDNAFNMVKMRDQLYLKHETLIWIIPY